MYVEAGRGCWISLIAFCIISLRNGLSLNLELAVKWLRGWSARLRDNPISSYLPQQHWVIGAGSCLASYVCAGVSNADLYFCAANTLTNWAISLEHRSLSLVSKFTRKFNFRFNSQGDLIYQLFAYRSYVHFKNPILYEYFPNYCSNT